MLPMDEKAWANGDRNAVCSNLHTFPIKQAADFAQFFPASLNGEKRAPEPAPMERETLAIELFRRHRMRHNGRTRNQSNLLSTWELLSAYERMVWLDTAADVQNVLATPPREGPPFCTAEHPDDFIFCHRPEGHAGNHKNNHINIEWAATTQGTPEGVESK
jgi:hypothetical protein